MKVQRDDLLNKIEFTPKIGQVEYLVPSEARALSQLLMQLAKQCNDVAFPGRTRPGRITQQKAPVPGQQLDIQTILHLLREFCATEGKRDLVERLRGTGEPWDVESVDDPPIKARVRVPDAKKANGTRRISVVFTGERWRRYERGDADLFKSSRTTKPPLLISTLKSGVFQT